MAVKLIETATIANKRYAPVGKCLENYCQGPILMSVDNDDEVLMMHKSSFFSRITLQEVCSRMGFDKLRVEAFNCDEYYSDFQHKKAFYCKILWGRIDCNDYIVNLKYRLKNGNLILEKQNFSSNHEHFTGSFQILYAKEWYLVSSLFQTEHQIILICKHFGFKYGVVEDFFPDDGYALLALECSNKNVDISQCSIRFFKESNLNSLVVKGLKITCFREISGGGCKGLFGKERIYYAYRTSCYYVLKLKQSITHIQANDKCKAINTTLLGISTQDEARFIDYMLKSSRIKYNQTNLGNIRENFEIPLGLVNKKSYRQKDYELNTDMIPLNVIGMWMAYESIDEGIFITSVIFTTDFPSCTGDTSFRCNNGKCLPKSSQCDNTADCLDGADEHNCRKPFTDRISARVDSKSYCKYGKQIRLHEFCDKKYDCADKTDETKDECSS
ncbi:DgyrCDS14370 [Dimorphilus gyrociliatus]|uniref:DgyrCDS14370 n=1 Tax=Dimorphilus gyrociliatus TaxID=2664684 RepID=A0A7I8WDR8_9ANNE|nr:DgyrCDS14370 [Dimorphilus gyrociliatus]